MKAYINSIFFTLVVSTFLFSENKFLEEDKRKNFPILQNMSGKTANNEKRKIRALKHERKKQLLKD